MYDDEHKLCHTTDYFKEKLTKEKQKLTNTK